ncbi:hypothetical protein GIB67_025980 [Kingdonia uniflora]|uniref:Uncharacterized protein n=1 Tax=Kingdonia uniflora TaxID=39325 RepID=A0A7J7L8F0_9MAGN|nr:hypothetical protein GIB67_025980 [Kingdonia uniflora]
MASTVIQAVLNLFSSCSLRRRDFRLLLARELKREISLSRSLQPLHQPHAEDLGSVSPGLKLSLGGVEKFWIYALIVFVDPFIDVLKGKIVVKTLIEKTTLFGFIIAFMHSIIFSGTERKPLCGELISFGENTNLGVNEVNVAIKAGTQVVYPKKTGIKLCVNESNFVILMEEEILGISESKDIKELKLINDYVLIEATKMSRIVPLLFPSKVMKQIQTGTVIAVSPRSDKIITSKVVFSAGHYYFNSNETNYVIVKGFEVAVAGAASIRHIGDVSIRGLVSDIGMRMLLQCELIYYFLR